MFGVPCMTGGGVFRTFEGGQNTPLGSCEGAFKEIGRMIYGYWMMPTHSPIGRGLNVCLKVSVVATIGTQ